MKDGGESPPLPPKSGNPTPHPQKSQNFSYYLEKKHQIAHGFAILNRSPFPSNCVLLSMFSKEKTKKMKTHLFLKKVEKVADNNAQFEGKCDLFKIENSGRI